MADAVREPRTLTAAPRHPGRQLSSTLKCLALLDILAEMPGAAGVSELARASGAGRGTVHQQLSTLVAAGWVERLEGGTYRLSLHATRISRAALEQANLGSRVLPIMETLAADTGEAISLAVLDGASALIVQRVESGQTLRADLRIGTRMPLATTASGHVLAACALPHQLELLRDGGVALAAPPVLDTVRERGFAVVCDEYLTGISAVAAPVRDGVGRVVAALSIAGPTMRLGIEETVPLVTGAARDLDALLAGAR
jgi:IclR family acetate operon transcriptional repressor